MKNYIIIFCLLIVNHSWFAQDMSLAEKTNFNRLLNKGIEIYNAGRPYEALETYKTLEIKHPGNWKIMFRLAQCHYEFSSFYVAEEYMDKAVKLAEESEERDVDYYELIAKIKHRLGKAEEASAAYKKTAALMGEKMAKEFGIMYNIEQCELILTAQKQGVKNIREPVSSALSSTEDEYSPIMSKDGKELFFTARKAQSTGENVDPDNLKYFEDIYHATYNEELKDFKLDYSYFSEINSNGFDAMTFINENKTYALFTINTSASSERTTKSADIFEMVVEGKVSQSQMSVIKSKGVNTDYFEGSATTTDNPNGDNMMLFVSDRKAETTGLDIFQCTRQESSFGPVVALPKNINSSGDETTPFITADGQYLFFSSNFLPGYGGYDIYFSKMDNGKWSDPINLGPQINSVNDDTHFRLNANSTQAYWAGLADSDGLFSYEMFTADLKNLDFPFLK